MASNVLSKFSNTCNRTLDNPVKRGTMDRIHDDRVGESAARAALAQAYEAGAG